MSDALTPKTHRFEQNPQERLFVETFVKNYLQIDERLLEGIIFGWANSAQTIPKDNLSLRELNIILNIIQWLGSPVGNSFLQECGFDKSNGQVVE